MTAVTWAEYESEIESTKDTPYIALMGKLLCVFCDSFEANWLRYKLHWVIRTSHGVFVVTSGKVACCID